MSLQTTQQSSLQQHLGYPNVRAEKAVCLGFEMQQRLASANGHSNLTAPLNGKDFRGMFFGNFGMGDALR
ncbi:MAG: hypothetical protein AAFY05_25235, partial [Pseudomonadota bacterium]